MPQPDRPEAVPQLNLECIPDYVTSSDEDDEDYDSSSRPWDSDMKAHEPEHRKDGESHASDSFLGKRSMALDELND